LEYLQTVELGSHDPEMHWSPFAQSAALEQGQGPALPPQVTQAFS
jgi:hypothetical protein